MELIGISDVSRRNPMVDTLRTLLLNWQAIDGDGGPGTVNNLRGSWHIFCHLAAAAGLYWLPRRGAAWVGILYDSESRRYFAGICIAGRRDHTMMPLATREARTLLAAGEWRGFVEGASRGHILDRGANDPGHSRKVDCRQDYDQDVDSPKDGGPVWEMWTISRDIRASNRLGSSLIEAYAELLDVLGGRFSAVVARGRIEPEYGHLRQMCAMIDAGFIKPSEAMTEIEAVVIPSKVERLLLEASPGAFARAAHLLLYRRRAPCYFMYQRKIASFASASLLGRLATTLGPAVPPRRQ